MTKNERIKLLEDTQVVSRTRIKLIESNIQLLQQGLLAYTEYSNDRVNNLDRNINARFDKISKEKNQHLLIDVPFQLTSNGNIKLPNDYHNFYLFCRENNIDQTQIESIQLKIKYPK